MAAADAGQHGRDMPVTDVERLADLAVAPGDSRQPPLEGGDRKLGAAALDLGGEVEPDRLGIGRRLGQALAAQPGGEHFPVGGVGAPGVVGLRRAGVGLGGLRQAGQSAAEPASRQEQGRGRLSRRLGGLRTVFPSAFGSLPGALRAEFPGFSHGVRAPSESCPIMAILSDIPPPRQAGRISPQNSVTKRRATIHHAPSDSRRPRTCSPTWPTTPASGVPAPLRKRARAKPGTAKAPERHSLSAAGVGPGLGAGERKGRGGRSPVRRRRRPRASRRLSCAHDPPAAGALRSRLALQSAAASAKILRLNADEAALRDLRFAVGDPLGPAANLLSLWRDLAGRPPSLDPGRIRDAAARLDLAVDPNGLAASLKACAGEGDPVSAAAKAAAAGVLRLPGRPSGRSRNPRPLGVRPRPRHPAALGAAPAADRDENSGPNPAVSWAPADGQGRTIQPGQTPPRARSRWPPPPPSTSPLISRAAPKP